MPLISLFMNEILSFTSFSDFDGVFAVNYINNKWDKCPKSKKTEQQEYMKLISRYEAIPNRKRSAASKISNIETVESMTELPKLILIQWTLKLRRFGTTIVELPPNIWTEITIEFFINYKSILRRMEDLLKLTLKTIVFILGILPQKLTLARFFKKIYKIKVMIVFPALAILVLKHLSLELT